MFKGLGNIGNIASMVGSMQQLPEKMKELTERMKGENVTAESACGRVSVTMNGVGEVQAVNIQDGAEGSELENAILEASNNAGAMAKQMYGQAISDMVADMNLNIPGIDGMLSSLTGGG